MSDNRCEFDGLDRLMTAHPPSSGPADFPERLMRQIASVSALPPLWQSPTIQWLAAAAGLIFTLGRLLAYIFSAWLSVQLAG